MFLLFLPIISRSEAEINRLGTALWKKSLHSDCEQRIVNRCKRQRTHACLFYWVFFVFFGSATVGASCTHVDGRGCTPAVGDAEDARGARHSTPVHLRSNRGEGRRTLCCRSLRTTTQFCCWGKRAFKLECTRLPAMPRNNRAIAGVHHNYRHCAKLSIPLSTPPPLSLDELFPTRMNHPPTLCYPSAARARTALLFFCCRGDICLARGCFVIVAVVDSRNRLLLLCNKDFQPAVTKTRHHKYACKKNEKTTIEQNKLQSVLLR